jgi:hypothetical protein
MELDKDRDWRIEKIYRDLAMEFAQQPPRIPGLITPTRGRVLV